MRANGVLVASRNLQGSFYDADPASQDYGRPARTCRQSFSYL